MVLEYRVCSGGWGTVVRSFRGGDVDFGFFDLVVFFVYVYFF